MLNNHRLKIFVLASAAVLVSALWIYLATFNLSHNALWFFHPDERDLYTSSHSLYTTGKLTHPLPLNGAYDAELFTPDGSSANKATLLPARSLGIYMLLAVSFIFGTNGPFYVIAICGVLTLGFTYLIVRKVVGGYAGILSVIFFGFSPQFLMWNNMLFSNVPAMMFFLGGVYFAQWRRRSILPPLFFAFSILMRYEFALFVCIYFVTDFLIQRNKRAVISRYVMYGAVAALILGIVPLMNKSIYGSFASFGYTQKSYDLNAGKTIDYGLDNNAGPLQVLQKYGQRFGGQFSDKNIISNFIINASQYLLRLSSIIVILGLGGLALLLAKRGIVLKVFAPFLAISLFVLIYFNTAPGYNGFNKGWLVGSYTRYLLMVVLTLSILAAIFINRFWSSSYHKQRLVPIVMGAYVFLSAYALFNAPLGLSQVSASKNDYAKIEEQVRQLPDNAIVVSSFYSKAIISRPVLNPNLIPTEKTARPQKSTEYVDDLLHKGYTVFTLENPNHSSYMHLDEVINNNTRLKSKKFHDGQLSEVTLR